MFIGLITSQLRVLKQINPERIGFIPSFIKRIKASYISKRVHWLFIKRIKASYISKRVHWLPLKHNGNNQYDKCQPRKYKCKRCKRWQCR